MFDWDTFMRLLGNRGVTDTCPACGESGTWAHGNDLVGLLLADENRNIRPTGGIIVAPLACQSCGYLRLFVPAVIEGYAPSDDEASDGG
jgi:hypothetical protein